MKVPVAAAAVNGWEEGGRAKPLRVQGGRGSWCRVVDVPGLGLEQITRGTLPVTKMEETTPAYGGST